MNLFKPASLYKKTPFLFQRLSFRNSACLPIWRFAGVQAYYERKARTRAARLVGETPPTTLSCIGMNLPLQPAQH